MKFCKRACLLVAILLLLTACTAKVAYKVVDWNISWYIDDYIDWTTVQEQDFDRRLDDFLLWHQLTQLPEYQALLTDLDENLSATIAREQVDAYVETVYGFSQQILRRGYDDAVVLLQQLDDEQVTDMLAAIAEKTDEKYAELYLEDREDYQDIRHERVEKMLKSWLGKLSPEQRQIIQQWSEQLENPGQEWLAYREHWNRAFAATMGLRHSEQFPPQLKQLIVHYDQYWTENYRQMVAMNTERGIDLFLAIQATASESQREHLRKKLQKWQNTIETIHIAAKQKHFKAACLEC